MAEPNRAPAKVIPLRPDLGSSKADRPADWKRRAAAGLAFLRRRLTGDYQVDDFGFDPELTEFTVLPMARQLYRRWFRTEVVGVHNLPAESGALIVANH